jgi:excisionase family DNA binding protein
LQVLHEGADVEYREELLDINEVAALVGLSAGTLYHWVSEKRIPFVRFSNRCIRFRLSDIQQWISESSVAPDSEKRKA